MAYGTILIGIVTAIFATVVTGFIYAFFSSNNKIGKLRDNSKCRAGRDYTTSKIKTSESSEYCDHVQRELKLTRQKVALKEIESQMTKEQAEEEKQAQKKQLEEIFKLMAEQKEQFGINSVDDVKDQMKLYI